MFLDVTRSLFIYFVSADFCFFFNEFSMSVKWNNLNKEVILHFFNVGNNAICSEYMFYLGHDALSYLCCYSSLFLQLIAIGIYCGQYEYGFSVSTTYDRFLSLNTHCVEYMWLSLIYVWVFQKSFVSFVASFFINLHEGNQ